MMVLSARNWHKASLNSEKFTVQKPTFSLKRSESTQRENSKLIANIFVKILLHSSKVIDKICLMQNCFYPYKMFA